MKISKNPLKTIYAAWFGLCTLVMFLILYPAIYFTLSNPKRYTWGHRIRRVWGKFLLLTGFIRVKQIYEEPIDSSKSYVITPNHTSQLDIITLTVKLNQLDFSFLAKAELEKIPLFGIWFRTIDIAVDRKNVRRAAEAYLKTVKYIENGRSMVIFPEGTISNQTPKLIKFKDGPFRLAIETQVDILPVTILGNHIVLPDQGVFEGQPGKVIQYVHKPISTKGMTLNDVDTLKDQVYNIINNKLKEHGYQ